jgi:hypothetical protein
MQVGMVVKGSGRMIFRQGELIGLSFTGRNAEKDIIRIASGGNV